MIRLHSTGLNDATILSNIFIDRFMPKANGEFVKVYIYLLRMLGRPEEAFGLSQMADSLFCTEGDILRALKYWESERRIILLDGEAELTGITLQAPWNEADMLATVTPQVSVTLVRSEMCLMLITFLPQNPQPAFPVSPLINRCRLIRSPAAAPICLSPLLSPNHFPKRKRLPRIG